MEKEGCKGAGEMRHASVASAQLRPLQAWLSVFHLHPGVPVLCHTTLRRDA
jgi:hypothetical protein